MAASREERNRILNMVAQGQISAEEAAQLFDALLTEAVAPSSQQNRTVRIWVTDMVTRSRQVNLTATLPLSILRVGLQALASVVPLLRDERVEQIVWTLESGASGRVLDLQDLEDGKRIEIFIE